MKQEATDLDRKHVNASTYCLLLGAVRVGVEFRVVGVVSCCEFPDW